MKQKVFHLTSETRRRVFELYNNLGVLLRMDDEVTGLGSRYEFRHVRPSLFHLYSYLWGKDDPSLTKNVFVEFPDSSSPRVGRFEPAGYVNSDSDLPF